MAQESASVSAIKITIENGRLRQEPIETGHIVIPLRHGERFQLLTDSGGAFSPEAIRNQLAKHAKATAELRRGCIPMVDDRGEIWCEPYACGACMAWIEWSTDGTVGIVRCVCLGG